MSPRPRPQPRGLTVRDLPPLTGTPGKRQCLADIYGGLVYWILIPWRKCCTLLPIRGGYKQLWQWAYRFSAISVMDNDKLATGGSANNNLMYVLLQHRWNTTLSNVGSSSSATKGNLGGTRYSHQLNRPESAPPISASRRYGSCNSRRNGYSRRRLHLRLPAASPPDADQVLLARLHLVRPPRHVPSRPLTFTPPNSASASGRVHRHPTDTGWRSTPNGLCSIQCASTGPITVGRQSPDPDTISVERLRASAAGHPAPSRSVSLGRVAGSYTNVSGNITLDGTGPNTTPARLRHVT